MGTVTLNKHNRLFWLGRYAERVYQGVEQARSINDQLVDGAAVDVDKVCMTLGIFATFESPEDFCNRFAFDRSLPESLICTADAMLGNGMVLRELLGSQTLSYLQMAVTALEAASTSQANDVQLQWVLDDIMAFRGSYGEFIEEESTRNTIRCGASVERVGIMLRLGANDRVLRRELQKLINRLYKTKLTHDPDKMARLNEFAFGKEDDGNREGLLPSVQSLFLI